MSVSNTGPSDGKPVSPVGESPRKRRPGKPIHAHPNRIEIRLRDISQLFNSMDPSPFHEQDLDHDAEEFIVSWVQEFPLAESVSLVIHLQQLPPENEPPLVVSTAIHNYFAYRARMTGLELKRLLEQGRASLAIGVVFLVGCLLTSELLVLLQSSTWAKIIRESLTIAGWVAMWRPMQIYLYDWWPLRRRGRLYEKMSRMEVELREHAQPPTPASSRKPA